MVDMIRKPTSVEISDGMPCHGCGERSVHAVIEGEKSCNHCGGDTLLCYECFRVFSIKVRDFE